MTRRGPLKEWVPVFEEIGRKIVANLRGQLRREVVANLRGQLSGPSALEQLAASRTTVPCERAFTRIDDPDNDAGLPE